MKESDVQNSGLDGQDLAAAEGMKKVIRDMTFQRQSDIVKPEDLEVPITVIGAGGIGSPTVFMLTKMGCSDVTVYDPDKVEIHNLPSQLYRKEDLDKLKVDALKQIVQSFNDVELKIKPEFYIAQKLSGIVISAVDKMTERKKIWQRVKLNPRVKLYIDARMGGEVARVYSICPYDKADIEMYEKTLYSDEESQQVPCTAKAIIYNVFGIAWIIGSTVKKFVSGQEVKKQILMDSVNLSTF